jgi:hypothetical protein
MGGGRGGWLRLVSTFQAEEHVKNISYESFQNFLNGFVTGIDWVSTTSALSTIYHSSRMLMVMGT